MKTMEFCSSSMLHGFQGNPWNFPHAFSMVFPWFSHAFSTRDVAVKLILKLDVTLYTFNINLWEQYQNFGDIVHKFLCLYMVCHRQMMDTVRINEIHPWLYKVRTDTDFSLVISRQKQISFTLPQTRNSVIHQGK